MSRSFKHSPYIHFTSTKRHRKCKRLFTRAFRRVVKYILRSKDLDDIPSWRNWKGKSVLHDDYYKNYYGKNYKVRSSLDFMDWNSWRQWIKK